MRQFLLHPFSDKTEHSKFKTGKFPTVETGLYFYLFLCTFPDQALRTSDKHRITLAPVAYNVSGLTGRNVFAEFYRKIFPLGFFIFHSCLFKCSHDIASAAIEATISVIPKLFHGSFLFYVIMSELTGGASIMVHPVK
jgi:hypothetical protein